MLDIAVITATSPEGRSGANVSRWFLGRAGLRADLNVDVIDLNRIALPPLHPGARPPRPTRPRGSSPRGSAPPTGSW
nr:hypothetical protein GCM10020093_043260 [Planobispora longispora]